MKRGFYRKLAWSGIRKNKKPLYALYPYLYGDGHDELYRFLPEREQYARGDAGRQNNEELPRNRIWVMCVFAPIFLFYTNSFLIAQTKKGIWPI